MPLDVSRLMVTAGIVSESDLRRALEIQNTRGGSLPRICHDLGVLDEARWARVLAKALSLPTVDVSQLDCDPSARGKVAEPLLRELSVFPFQLRDLGHTLVLAMAEPHDDAGRAQLKAASNCELKIAVAGYKQIELALQKYPNPNSPSGVSSFLAGGREGDVQFESGELGSEEPSEGTDPIFAEADLIESDAGTDLTDAEQRLLTALEQNTAQSSRALQAAIDLCTHRGLFTPLELRARLKK